MLVIWIIFDSKKPTPIRVVLAAKGGTPFHFPLIYVLDPTHNVKRPISRSHTVNLVTQEVVTLEDSGRGLAGVQDGEGGIVTIQTFVGSLYGRRVVAWATQPPAVC